MNEPNLRLSLFLFAILHIDISIYVYFYTKYILKLVPRTKQKLFEIKVRRTVGSIGEKAKVNEPIKVYSILILSLINFYCSLSIEFSFCSLSSGIEKGQNYVSMLIVYLISILHLLYSSSKYFHINKS